MVPRRSRQHPAEEISDLDLDRWHRGTGRILRKSPKSIGLALPDGRGSRSICIDTTKTKLITCSIPHSSLQLDGEDIENIEDFQFLASYIMSTGEHCLKGEAWSAVWKLDRVWKSPASLQQKFQLFKASALTVLLYGCEYWVLTSDLCRQLDSFQTSCIRIILGVFRTYHVSNEEVYDRTRTVPFFQSL